MNHTIEDTTGKAWQRIRLPYISAVCGIAIAISAAVTTGGWQSAHRPEAPRQSQPASGALSVSQPVQAPQEVYYFVNSQAQAAYAAYAEQVTAEERMSINATGPVRRVHVLMFSTEADEAAGLQVINEESRDADGISFAFVDLRNR